LFEFGASQGIRSLAGSEVKSTDDQSSIEKKSGKED
jgi:hypothetical protein